MKLFSAARELEAKIAALDRSQAVIEFKLDGTILKANGQFLEAMGYRLDEIVGKHHRMFVDPTEAASPAYENFWRSLRSGEHFSAEFRRFAKGGREIWISGSYNPVRNRRGVPYKVIKFARVVTEEVQARAKVAMLSLVAEGTNNSVVITDAEERIQYVNPSFERLTGYSAEEARGRKLGDFLEGERTDRAMAAKIRDHLCARKPFCEEVLSYTKSGEPYWIALTINPVLDESGDLLHFVSIQTNVTNAKDAAVELTARMSAIDKANAVLEWGRDGRLETPESHSAAIAGAGG